MLLNGQYELDCKLGEGTFGEVWRAQHVSTKRDVAVKLSKGNGDNILEYEAKVIHLLRGCPGTIKMRAFGKHSDGRHFIVMDLLGQPLRSLHSCSADVALSVEIRHIAVHMSHLLQAIHERGLIHRDVKPDNFLWGVGLKHNKLFIVDYGFCTPYRCKNGSCKATSMSGQPIGSPLYMSIDAHLGKELGRRDDFESMCYVIIWLMKGELPWSNMTPSVDRNITIMESKMKYRISIMKSTRHNPLHVVLNHVYMLDPIQSPDYGLIERVLSRE